MTHKALRGSIAGFFVVAAAAVTASFWTTGNPAITADTQPGDVALAVFGNTLTPGATPDEWHSFEKEKNAAGVEELPPQF